MFSPGQLLDGYRLIRVIGVGGFGTVWLAHSETLQAYLALKIVADGKRELPAVQKFKRINLAAHSAALMPIEHVGIVGKVLFCVMPLADGDFDGSPESPEWTPLTLGLMIARQRQAAA